MATETIAISTFPAAFRRVRATNATDSSFASKVPTTTTVNLGTAGVISTEFSAGGTAGVCNGLIVVPFGAGSDDTTFSMRVIGWRQAFADSLTTLWVPCPLATLSCTLCTAVGVAGATCINTDRFVDAITQTDGIASVLIPTVPANTICHFFIDTLGFELIEVTFDMTGSTNANALYARL